MRVHTGRLILIPINPDQRPDTTSLLDALRAGGFIGAPLMGLEQGYLVGNRFLNLITFAGCSVQIELTPPGNGSAFCHVVVDGPHDRPRLLSGRNTRPPRCPTCKTAFKDWRTRVNESDDGAPTRLACPRCGAEAELGNWNWRKNAGFGCLFLRVEEVFPGEAVPTPELMSLLEHSSGTKWRHFYVQDAGETRPA